MKRTAWILLAAAAAVGGLFLIADMLGNGIFLEFLSEQLFYMQEYTDTTGVLHQYLSPDWSRIKLLLFLLTMLTVGGCIIIVRLQVRKAAFQHKEDMQKAVEKALHQFLEERDFYLPEGYGGIEALLLQIRAKEQKQLALLEKQTQQKHDLISYLAHDMKTPLASVIGYLNLLNDVKDIPQPQKEAYLRITLDKADRLEGLIDEFFDITRFNLHDIVISRGKLQLIIDRSINYVWFNDAGKAIVSRKKDTIQMDNVKQEVEKRYGAKDVQVALGYGYDNPVYVVNCSVGQILLDYDNLHEVYYLKKGEA